MTQEEAELLATHIREECSPLITVRVAPRYHNPLLMSDQDYYVTLTDSSTILRIDTEDEWYAARTYAAMAVRHLGTRNSEDNTSVQALVGAPLIPLEMSDIPIILDILESYQSYIDETVRIGPWVGIPVSPSFLSPWKAEQAKMNVVLPLVCTALRGELPPHCQMVKMGGRYIAMHQSGRWGVSEPATHFQALLWLWKRYYLDEMITRAEDSPLLPEACPS